MLFPKIVAVLFIASVSARFKTGEGEDKCSGEASIGNVWADGKIKIECTGQGSKPVACLPDGKLESTVVKPGEHWTSEKFKFECKETGPLSLSWVVTMCILPTGAELAIGASAGISNKGVYSCVQNPTDGTVSRKYQSGCYFNDKLYTPSQSWSFEKSQITCVGASGNFEAKASGCVVTAPIVRQNEIVPVGSYKKVEDNYFKCKQNDQVAWQADFVQIGAEEYNEWAKGTAEDEEEEAAGDSASGHLNPPTTTPEPTTTTESTTTTEPTTTKVTESTTACPPVPTTPEGCQDLHPICKTLCSRSCNDGSVAMANPGKRMLISIGDKPGRGWQGGWGGGGGGGWGGFGGSGGGGWIEIGGGHSGGKDKPGKHDKWDWGKPGKHDKPGKGHGHGFGHGHHGGHHSSSMEETDPPTRPPTRPPTQPPTEPPTEPPAPITTPRPQPPVLHPACFDMANSGFELISTFCPKSCGACDKQVNNLEEIASKWNTASCIAKNPIEPVGLPQARKGKGKGHGKKEKKEKKEKKGKKD